MPNKFMAAARRGVTSELGWQYDPPWFWNITRRSKARSFVERCGFTPEVWSEWVNPCNVTPEQYGGGVTNDLAV